jgi:hypothetical protein
MAADFLSFLRDRTFSTFEKPDSDLNVSRNALRVSLRGAIATASVAAVAALFSRNVIERDAIAPYVLKASLISCGTFTVFAAFMLYRACISTCISRSTHKRIIAQTFNLTSGLSLSCFKLITAAIFARDFLNPNQMINSLAERSIHPLLWIGLTSFAFQIFQNYQTYQNKQIGNS